MSEKAQSAPYGSQQQIYASPTPAGLTSAPPASLLRWFSSTAAAGILVGLLWWFSAPGGAFYGKGTDTTIWLPRDLTLGLLCILAGVLTGALLVRQRRLRGAWAKLIAAVLGSGLGAVAAWLIGTFCGVLWGPSSSGNVSESIAFSLRTYSVLLLWPFAAALVFFVITLGSLLRSPPADSLEEQ
ncbi:hypothetical protein FHU41_000204 [Psychromicrobium silvestre]|uniref:Uncharacterized protein n=1 Tax=Psychromicrobium silvestre TaxID=1645614 RepID=A0A7Y9LR00_9MICC|nr:hypothetical protein [Psychromicrobium silvestre]NYE93983.1 hypothetical protein [Psychromicrobium silvestre]